MKLTLEIEGDGDMEQFKRDLLEVANGDPDFRVSIVEDDQ